MAALHHQPKAKRVVQLFMAGGAPATSICSTSSRSWSSSTARQPDFGEHVEAFQNGLGPVAQADLGLQAVRQVRQACSARSSRRSAMSSTRWPSSTTWSARRASTRQGTLLQTTGFNRPGFPGMGCWVSYGLGSMNDNLPTFVVLPDHRGLASNGTKNWDSRVPPGAAPGHGHLSRREDADRRPVPGRARDVHHARRRRGRHRPAHAAEPRARRRRAPATSGSTPASGATNSPRRCSSPRPRRSTSRRNRRSVLKLYGLDHGKTSFDKEINPLEETDYFGRKCLAARRLLERGVRFVQIWSGNDNGFPRRNWDSHEDVEARPRPARLRHGPRRGGAHPGPETARPARRHDHSLDDRVRPHAVARRAARAATTIRTASPTGSAAAASRAASRHGPSDEWGYKPRRPQAPDRGLRHPRHDPAPARHRPHEAHRPPQRHRPPADRCARARDQRVVGVILASVEPSGRRLPLLHRQSADQPRRSPRRPHAHHPHRRVAGRSAACTRAATSGPAGSPSRCSIAPSSRSRPTRASPATARSARSGRRTCRRMRRACARD